MKEIWQRLDQIWLAGRGSIWINNERLLLSVVIMSPLEIASSWKCIYFYISRLYLDCNIFEFDPGQVISPHNEIALKVRIWSQGSVGHGGQLFTSAYIWGGPIQTIFLPHSTCLIVRQQWPSPMVNGHQCAPTKLDWLKNSSGWMWLKCAKVCWSWVFWKAIWHS